MDIESIALTPVATALPTACANSAAGFQQISELVGPRPPELQKIIVFSAGTPVNAKRAQAAREIIRFLVNSVGPAIAKSGMGPVNARAVG